MFNAMRDSTVRTAGLLRAQKPTVLQKIRDAMRAEVERYTKRGIVQLPMPALIAMPMEPANVAAFDPGPQALLTSLPPNENQARLDWALRRAVGVVGIVNELGDRFTAVESALRPLLDGVKARGLIFVDARTSSRSRVAKIATEIGLPWAIVDRVIDEEPSRDAIDGRLAEIVAVARRVLPGRVGVGAEGFAGRLE